MISATVTALPRFAPEARVRGIPVGATLRAEGKAVGKRLSPGRDAGKKRSRHAIHGGRPARCRDNGSRCTTQPIGYEEW